jgi:hypothetical protein
LDEAILTRLFHHHFSFPQNVFQKRGRPFQSMSLTVEQQLEPGVLAAARYGKDKVRVFRVVRDPESKVYNVVEHNVTVLVEGAIETRSAHIPTLPVPVKTRRVLK